MNKMKSLYLKVIMITYFSAEALASSGAMKSWGRKIVHDGQTIGLSWMSAAVVICGFLSILGLQFAQGMLARILLGSGLIFGAGAISVFLKGVFA